MLSLWKVPDIATAILMERVYDGLLVRKMPRHEALRDAQRFLRTASVGELRRSWLLPATIDRLAGGDAALKRELLELSASADDLRPFAAPKNWGAFICQGEVSALPHPASAVPRPVNERPAPVAHALLGEASACADRGDFEKAFALLKQEERRCRKAGDRAGRAETLRYQAQVVADSGDAPMAMPILYESEKLYRRLHDEVGMAKVRVTRAEILSMIGGITTRAFGSEDRQVLALALESIEVLRRLKRSHDVRWAEQVIERVRTRLGMDHSA
jgi:hypothetical protein